MLLIANVVEWNRNSSSLDQGGLGRIEPDQMQALNSLFILLFIPLFEEVIYPIFARWNLLIKYDMSECTGRISLPLCP